MILKSLIKNKLEFKEINLNDLLNQNNYIISIYDIKKDKDDNIQISVDSDGKEIGYFINNNNIIRIGFIWKKIVN